ncbi:GntR family transcriptional regulator [soil metagenome]
MKEPRLTLVQSRSLPEQIADSIVEGIASGAFAPGQRVVENEVALELNVSRVPVREALKILLAQGIVVGRPHHGVRVAQFDDEKIVKLYEVRCALEKIAVRDACKRRSTLPALLSKLDAILIKMGQCLESGDFLGISRADLEFHREICLASQNEIVTTIWDTLSRHMLIVFEHELLSDTDRSNIVEHHRTLRTLIGRSKSKEVDAEIEKHIMRLRGNQSNSQTVRLVDS